MKALEIRPEEVQGMISILGLRNSAEEKIAGTPKETYTGGRGWRMAVILMATIISAPSLRAALRDGSDD